jgi:hypothetical protein
LGFYHEGLLSAVSEHLPLRLNECVSQDLSNVVYSFGMLGYLNYTFIEIIRNYVVEVLIPKGLGQKDMSYIVSAFRKVDVDLE